MVISVISEYDVLDEFIAYRVVYIYEESELEQKIYSSKLNSKKNSIVLHNATDFTQQKIKKRFQPYWSKTSNPHTNNLCFD